jgi:hypothetical protein
MYTDGLTLGETFQFYAFWDSVVSADTGDRAARPCPPTPSPAAAVDFLKGR